MEQNKTFQQSLHRLETIVNELEKNEIELEHAMQLFEEGLQLALSCEQSLKSFENKAATLLKTYQEAQS